jgi:hypothetical protein
MYLQKTSFFSKKIILEYIEEKTGRNKYKCGVVRFTISIEKRRTVFSYYPFFSILIDVSDTYVFVISYKIEKVRSTFFYDENEFLLKA